MREGLVARVLVHLAIQDRAPAIFIEVQYEPKGLP
jgi:hypothetical protein